MEGISTIGIDLAKSVFQVHGVDAGQKVVVSRQLKRRNMLSYFARLPPCLIGMEACGGAHYWARELGKLGHTVRLLVARDVKAYVRRGSWDAADAAAICEAVTRAHVGTVTVKTEEQQCLLMLHKTRAQYLETRTRYVNIVRAHLSELGIVAPQGQAGFSSLLGMLAGETGAVPLDARVALRPCLDMLQTCARAIGEAEAAIRAQHKQDETSRRLEAGERVTLRNIATAIARAPGQIGFFGAILAFTYFVWLQIALLMLMLFLGSKPLPPASAFIQTLLFTPYGLGLLVSGTVVGGLLAFVVFAISAISVPLLMRRPLDAVSAISASVAAVRMNPKAMTLWAALIAGFMALGIATLFVGLVVAFPLVGHATWHACRDLVRDDHP